MKSPKTDADRSGQSPHQTTANGLVFKWCRWLHVYLSFVSLAAIVFFSLTGLTLNHPDWFFSESTQQTKGTIPATFLNVDSQPPIDWDGCDYGHQIDKLTVAEQLRAEHHLRGRVSSFLASEDRCKVTFQGPGYAATALIDRQSGDYALEINSNDLISTMNDLHKGRHAGPVWSIVIDVSAIVSTVVALTGFFVIFYVNINQKRRVVLPVVGTALVGFFCYVALN